MYTDIHTDTNIYTYIRTQASPIIESSVKLIYRLQVLLFPTTIMFLVHEKDGTQNMQYTSEPSRAVTDTLDV